MNRPESPAEVYATDPARTFEGALRLIALANEHERDAIHLAQQLVTIHDGDADDRERLALIQGANVTTGGRIRRLLAGRGEVPV